MCRQDDGTFSIYGVQLFRNPVQTMDKIKSLIPGLKNEDSLDAFWEGSITDSKFGTIPVYMLYLTVRKQMIFGMQEYAVEKNHYD